ncbi:hypothetical protein QVD99_001437 [Batrachochytrium dendrobatidis]|nr:hypothetical protein O5D80_005906 [Batrachochytrium dendrobatidis]KAK5671591.1 hypothetical protein QVD99_001437 [Batrachochytrium dendrobatidis]
MAMVNPPPVPGKRRQLPRSTTITNVYSELVGISLKTSMALPVLPTNPQNLNPSSSYYQISDNILDTLAIYDFAIEKAAVAEYQKSIDQIAKEDELVSEIKERQTKSAVEATDSNELKKESRSPVKDKVSKQLPERPVPTKQGTLKGSQTVPISNVNSSTANSIDYTEFEQGLAPPDPWDTAANIKDHDFKMLKEVMGKGDRAYESTQPFALQQSLGRPIPVVAEMSPASKRLYSATPPQLQHNSSPQAPTTLFESMRVGSANSLSSVPCTSGSMPMYQGASVPIPLQQQPPQIPTRVTGHQSLPNSKPETPKRPPRFTTDAQYALYSDFTQMGFDSDTVAYAINHYFTTTDPESFSLQKKGQDLHKKILDFLIGMAELSSACGTPIPLDVLSMAINQYPENVIKQAEFSQAFIAVSELGFPPGDVRDALVFKQNNREEAIEYLMSGVGRY